MDQIWPSCGWDLAKWLERLTANAIDNSSGLNPSTLWHSWFSGAADEAVLNKVLTKMLKIVWDRLRENCSLSRCHVTPLVLHLKYIYSCFFQVPVGHPSEVDEIFDKISYDKGASVIRMLYNWIGSESFKRGMSKYLTKYSYKVRWKIFLVEIRYFTQYSNSNTVFTGKFSTSTLLIIPYYKYYVHDIPTTKPIRDTW